MKTLSIDRTALDRTARNFGAARTTRPEPRLATVAGTGAALERQLDEIQHTFSARWEW